MIRMHENRNIHFPTIALLVASCIRCIIVSSLCSPRAIVADGVHSSSVCHDKKPQETNTYLDVPSMQSEGSYLALLRYCEATA